MTTPYTDTHTPSLSSFCHASTELHTRTSKKVETQCRRLSRTFFQRIARSWVLMRTMVEAAAALVCVVLFVLEEAAKPDGDARGKGPDLCVDERWCIG